MTAEANVEQAKRGYAAFQRGDVAGFMERLADDVEWTIPGPASVPVAGTRRGTAAMREWFGLVGQTMEFQVFEPREYVAQGDTVVAVVREESTVKPTGRRLALDVVHLLTFRGGKLARFRAFADTAAVAAAWQGA
jgi:ketosteroid isomerase-like protein